MNRYDREKFKNTKGWHDGHQKKKQLEIEKEESVDKQRIILELK